MTTPLSGWEGIFQDGERILWQGRPDTDVVWRDLLSSETVFGVFFTGFSVFWIASASSIINMGPHMGGGGIGAIFSFFPLFGLPFLAVGLHMVIGRIFFDAYMRGKTWYTLSNEAAYIARDAMGRRSLKRYGFAEMLAPDLVDGHPGSIFFAEELKQYQSGSRNSSRRTTAKRTRIGFRRIDDARTVYRLIADQRDAAKAPPGQTR